MSRVTLSRYLIEQDLVGDHVELLLHFALDVFSAHAAQNTTQCAFGHGVADFLASTRAPWRSCWVT